MHIYLWLPNTLPLSKKSKNSNKFLKKLWIESKRSVWSYESIIIHIEYHDQYTLKKLNNQKKNLSNQNFVQSKSSSFKFSWKAIIYFSFHIILDLNEVNIKLFHQFLLLFWTFLIIDFIHQFQLAYYLIYSSSTLRISIHHAKSKVKYWFKRVSFNIRKLSKFYLAHFVLKIWFT